MCQFLDNTVDSRPLDSMEKFLGHYYSSEELKDLESILKTPPLYTTIRVNTLKCSKSEAKTMLSDYFVKNGETFLVEENPDFPDVLMIKAIGPNPVQPVTKGIRLYNFIILYLLC